MSSRRRTTTAPTRPSDGRARRAHVAAVARATVLAFTTGIATACYANVPLSSAPATGTPVVLEVNDRGRLALSESMGPSVGEIEGVLTSRTDSAYVVHVASVEYLNGNRTKWNGEAITVRADLVNRAAERRLSRSRTALVAIVAAGATLAFILTRSIFGSGTPEGEPGEGGSDGQ